MTATNQTYRCRARMIVETLDVIREPFANHPNQRRL